MRLKRTGLFVLALGGIVGAGELGQNEAMAKGRCAAGQILRVSSGTCMSRDAAIQQGIIGGKRKAVTASTTARAASSAQEAEPQAQAQAETETETAAQPVKARARVARAAPEQSPRRAARPERQARQTLSDATDTRAESQDAAPVRVEVVKTAPRPTPDRFMPTWPYGELAAFPKRSQP